MVFFYTRLKVLNCLEPETELNNSPKSVDLPNLNEIPEHREVDSVMEIL